MLSKTTYWREGELEPEEEMMDGIVDGCSLEYRFFKSPKLRTCDAVIVTKTFRYLERRGGGLGVNEATKCQREGRQERCG